MYLENKLICAILGILVYAKIYAYILCIKIVHRKYIAISTLKKL